MHQPSGLLELWLVSAGPNTCKQAIDIFADPLISILVFSSDAFCHWMDSEDADSTTNNKSNAVTTSNLSTHRFLPLFLYVQRLGCHVTSSRSSSFMQLLSQNWCLWCDHFQRGKPMEFHIEFTHWDGLREKLQESPILNGTIYGFL